jgi:hypothetical protein
MHAAASKFVRRVFKFMDDRNAYASRAFECLGTLLLAQPEQMGSDTQFAMELDAVANANRAQLNGLLTEAETQRVLRRVLAILQQNLHTARSGTADALLSLLSAAENRRAATALAALQSIVACFDECGIPVLVMKTLDHWPDTGSDLDLLALAGGDDVCRIFTQHFQAEKQSLSWGDRLARKFNFRLPDLKELVEVHVGCLGQTGEHQSLARNVMSRRQHKQFGQHSLPVPSPEDQIVIASLQRMYRHYYIRLTDIVNIYGLIAEGQVDFERLRTIAELASIWPGVATLVTVACQHAIRYGARDIALPSEVAGAALFHANRTYLQRRFVRIPLVPEATSLFLRQVAGNGRRLDFRAVARLGLLPALATAAYLTFRFTGNDKGVW